MDHILAKQKQTQINKTKRNKKDRESNRTTSKNKREFGEGNLNSCLSDSGQEKTSDITGFPSGREGIGGGGGGGTRARRKHSARGQKIKGTHRKNVTGSFSANMVADEPGH